MPLSPEQIAAVQAAAAEAGVDAGELVAAAEQIEAEESGTKSGAASGGLPKSDKIYQYHLPFIFVKELRQSLGLTEAHPGDNMTCAEWAAQYAPSPSTTAEE